MPGVRARVQLGHKEKRVLPVPGGIFPGGEVSGIESFFISTRTTQDFLLFTTFVKPSVSITSNSEAAYRDVLILLKTITEMTIENAAGIAGPGRLIVFTIFYSPRRNTFSSYARLKKQKSIMRSPAAVLYEMQEAAPFLLFPCISAEYGSLPLPS